MSCLAGEWGWESTYGEELYAKLATLNTQALVPLPPKNAGRSKKRVVVEVEGQEETGTEKPKKRQKPALKPTKKAPLISDVPSEVSTMQNVFQVANYVDIGRPERVLKPTTSTFRGFGGHEATDEVSNPVIWAPSVANVRDSQVAGPSRLNSRALSDVDN